MNAKIFQKITGTVFLIIACLHVLRLIFRWEVMIGSWNIPLWASLIAIALFSTLAYHGLKKPRS